MLNFTVVMHPDLSFHLHTEECNILIMKLNECHEKVSFSKQINYLIKNNFLDI